MRDPDTYNRLMTSLQARPKMVPESAVVAPSPSGKRSHGNPMRRYEQLESAYQETEGKLTVKDLADIAGANWLHGQHQAECYWLGDLVWDLIHGYVTVEGVTGREVVEGWIRQSLSGTAPRPVSSQRRNHAPLVSEETEAETSSDFDFIDAFLGIAKLTPKQAHPSHIKIFTQGLSAEQKSPAPGLVGSKYRPGGVLFVARNGALGTSPEHLAEDRQTAHLWAQFADASEERRAKAFSALMRHLNEGVYSWNLFRYIKAFNKQAGLPEDDFALVNMIAFRCKFELIKNFGPIYEEAYQNYTRQLLEALRPGLIIPLGNDQGRQLSRLHQSNAPIASPIRRSIGDRFDPKTLDEDIQASLRLYRSK